MVLCYREVIFYGIFLKENNKQKRNYIFKFMKVFMTLNAVTLPTNLTNQSDMFTIYSKRALVTLYLISGKKSTNLIRNLTLSRIQLVLVWFLMHTITFGWLKNLSGLRSRSLMQDLYICKKKILSQVLHQAAIW